MENRGKILSIDINWYIIIISLVTVYTQFGYASVDLDKYKEELVVTSASASPDKHGMDDLVDTSATV